jgi:hypothetical protein
MNGRADQPGERVCERALVWHLGQFRLSGHAALLAAASEARMVFPLVVMDRRDPLTGLAGYYPAVRALARDYAELGAPLLYLEGDSSERVVDAARDARADYLYVLKRADAAGQALLEEACAALELWGFGCRVFEAGQEDGEESRMAPTSLSGAALPGLPLPPGPPRGERELSELGASRLDEAARLGLLSPRRARAAGGSR